MLECVLFAPGGDGHNEGRPLGVVGVGVWVVLIELSEFGCGCWLGVGAGWGWYCVLRGCRCIGATAALQGYCSCHSKAGQADRHGAAHPITKPIKRA